MPSQLTHRPRRDLRRRALAALFCALTLTLVVTAGAQLAGAANPVPDDIGITVVTAPGPTACLAPAAAANVTVFITELSYTVTIRAHAPICPPVTAVVYSMPSNPLWPWPQHRLESKTVTIGTGVTTIVFTRGCAPTQFDVITGVAPDTIRPDTGPMPGPMLSANPWTGIQNWKGPCPGTTTTPAPSSSTTSTETTTSTTTVAPDALVTPPSTTTSTVPAPSSTVVTTPVTPSAVKATDVSTDDPDAVDAATASVSPVVMDATATRSGVDAATAAQPLTAAPSDLAFTGSTSAPLELAGVSVLLLGAALAATARRRRSTSDPTSAPGRRP
jgi:hypothetical protein